MSQVLETATHRILRPLWMGAEKLPMGTEVDASKWPNFNLLVTQGYLEPISKKPLVPPWKRGREKAISALPIE